VNQPRIIFGTQHFLRLFWELSSERQFGMGVGPIPISKVREVARENRYDEESLELLLIVIKTLDAAYMKWMRDRVDTNRRLRNSQAGSKEPSGGWGPNRSRKF
jgi:hypothetical protein